MENPDAQWKARKIIGKIEEEGRVLLAGRPSEIWCQKPDGTFFSQKEVDLERRMLDFLTAPDMFPGAVFVGEETNAYKGLEKGRINIVLDPMDGSALNRLKIPVWGISLAILDEDLSPLVAILYYPGLDRWYAATGEKGRLVFWNVVFRDGLPELSAVEDAAKRAVPPPGLRVEDSYLYVNSSPTVLNMSGLNCKIRAFGCTSFHLAALADGLGDPLATALYSYRIYDVAAALAILSSCGIVIFDLMESRPIGFSELMALPRKRLDCRPLLVGHPEALARLEGRVRLKNKALVAVDEYDRRPNPAAPKLCLELGLWHRCAHIEICRGERFLVFRGTDGRLELPSGPARWLFKENRPETRAEAAARIVVEKLYPIANLDLDDDLEIEKWRNSLAESSRLSFEQVHGESIRREHVLVFRLIWKKLWQDPALFESAEEEKTWRPVWLGRNEILAEKRKGTPMNGALILLAERLASGSQKRG